MSPRPSRNPVPCARRLGGALTLVGALLAGCAALPPAQEPLRIVEDAHGGGSALAIAPDSATGASGGWEGRVRLWRLPDGAAQRSWRAHAGQVTGLAFLADGQHLLSAGWDGAVRLWNRSGRQLQQWQVGAPVSSFAAAGDRGSVLLGLSDGRIQWWSVGGRLLGAWQPGRAAITAVAVNAAGAVFAAADRRGRVWRWRSDSPVSTLQSAPSYLRALAFEPGSDDLLGSGWFKLYRWPADGAAMQAIPTDHRGIINDLQFSRDGSYLATISRQTDSAVLLLDPRSGRTLHAFRKHALCGQRVVLAPDGRLLLSTSDDASVRFYRLPE